MDEEGCDGEGLRGAGRSPSQPLAHARRACPDSHQARAAFVDQTMLGQTTSQPPHPQPPHPQPLHPMGSHAHPTSSCRVRVRGGK